MVNVCTLKKLLGVTPQDQAELDLYHQAMAEHIDALHAELSQWVAEYANRDDVPLVMRAFVEVLAFGEGEERFFPLVYRQTLDWRAAGLSETSIMMLLSRLRQRFVELAELLNSAQLARALCHNVDLAQTILSSVFQLSRTLERFHERAEFEIKRVEHMFLLIEQEAPHLLIQAYREHQRWKQLAYEVALGMAVSERLETDPTRCGLSLWLESGGWEILPEERREAFDHAHRRVHLLGKKMLEMAKNQAPDQALEMIWDIEEASDEVTALLLECLDQIFVEVATQDALTGLPNRRSFERDYHKALKMARRYGFYLGLHLLDLDHFKRINDTLGHLKGDEVLKAFSQTVVAQLRDEDHLYRWGGEEFAIVTLHQDAQGAEAFAARLFENFSGTALQEALALPWPVTISMASVEVPPDLTEAPIDTRVFAAADQLLYMAKEAGRNQLWAGTMDEKGYLREDTIHRVRP